MNVEVEKYDQVSAAPTNKVAASGIGGSVSVVVIWLINTVFGIEIPSEVAASIATIAAFASGYLVREKRVVSSDQIQ